MNAIRIAEYSYLSHSILSTCEMKGISQLEYLKKFYSAIVEGRDDFENLHPAAIGLNLNKQKKLSILGEYSFITAEMRL